MRLRNINPMGRVDLPLIGRILEPGETFEVDNDMGLRLLEQADNYEAVDSVGAPEEEEE